MSETSQLPPIMVLAGGLGTRLGDRAKDVPKAMVPVAGAPFIDHQLRLLSRAGFSRVIMCLSYKSEQIQEFIGDGSRYGLTVESVSDGGARLGTGGAVRHALHRVQNVFAIIYGDTYLDIDYAAAFRAFDCSGAEALMTVLNNEDKWGKSNVCFRAGVIESYDKNASGPHIRHIDYGLSFIRRDAVASMPDGEKFDLAELFQKLIEKKQLAGHEVSNRFYEINTPESLIETEEYLWSTINGVDKS